MQLSPFSSSLLKITKTELLRNNKIKQCKHNLLMKNRGNPQLLNSDLAVRPFKLNIPQPFENYFYSWEIQNFGKMIFGFSAIKFIASNVLKSSDLIPDKIFLDEIAICELFIAIILKNSGIENPQIFNPSIIQRLPDHLEYFSITSKSSMVPFFWVPGDLSQLHFPPALSSIFYTFSLSIFVGFIKKTNFNTNLKSGDVLFTGWHPSLSDGWLGSGNVTIPINFSTNHIKATGDWFMKELLSDNMPVDISIEVGKLRLRGEELNQLIEGEILPLGITPGGQVNLLYDNRIIAKGELMISEKELVVKLITTPDFNK